MDQASPSKKLSARQPEGMTISTLPSANSCDMNRVSTISRMMQKRQKNPSGNRTRTAPSAAVLRTKFLDNADVVQNSRLVTALVPLLALGGCSSKAYRKRAE